MIQNKYQDKINVTAFIMYNSLKKILRKYVIPKCKKFFTLTTTVHLSQAF